MTGIAIPISVALPDLSGFKMPMKPAFKSFGIAARAAAAVSARCASGMDLSHCRTLLAMERICRKADANAKRQSCRSLARVPD